MTAITKPAAATILRRIQKAYSSSPAWVEALALAVEALDPWQAPRATLPWVNVKDHPHPTDGTAFLTFVKPFGVGVDCLTLRPRMRLDWVAYWCLLPEEATDA